MGGDDDPLAGQDLRHDHRLPVRHHPRDGETLRALGAWKMAARQAIVARVVKRQALVASSAGGGVS